MDNTNTNTGGPSRPGPCSPGPYYPSQHPGAADDGDAEWAEYVAWLDREAAAGP